MSKPREIIVAHPSRVAQADQVAAAEPRKTPNKVVLRDWIPDTHVYVLDVEQLEKQLDARLDELGDQLRF